MNIKNIFGIGSDKAFRDKLVQLVFPIMFQTFMLALVSATDAVMLGLLNQDSLSASSLGGQVQLVFSLFVNGIASGTGILMAQYWGKNDRDAVEHVLPITLRYMLPVGLAFTMLTLLLPSQIMCIFTNDAELIRLGAIYLRTVSLSYIFCAISQTYLTALKNTGRTSVCSVISSLAVVLNIILNAILIFGLFGMPAMGIAGAALATVISRAVELLLSIWQTSDPKQIRVRWKYFFSSRPLLSADFRKYTFPIVLALLVWGGAFTQYSVIMGHLGGDATAAYSIIGIVKNLFSCLINGLAGGTSIMMGNVLGTGDMEQAWEYSRRFFRLSIMVGIITGLAIIVMIPIITIIAPLSKTAEAYLRWMLVLCGINIMFNSFNRTILNGILFSGGDSAFDMYGNIGAMWCCTVPLGYLTTFFFHLAPPVVFIFISLDEIVKIPAVVHRYQEKRWLKNITR